MNTQAIRKPPRWVVVALALTLLLQISVLAGEYLHSVWPLHYGEPIRIKTVPVDPRSLFRGNYVRLRYGISDLPKDMTAETLQPGQRVYVPLQQDEDGTYSATGILTQAPNSGLFIRGRMSDRRRWSNNQYRIRYGIEAYFLPKKKALAMERIARGNAEVTVYLLKNGKAALHSIHCTADECPDGSQ